jgi:cytochrome d ubiquinol oxidase subunit II
MSGLVLAWYLFVGFTLVMYVVLDGFDLGAGALHLHLAKTDEEREDVLRTIGPVWDGNEVWLVVAGATLFLAFPLAFARAFSGFYLPLNLVLWLLVFRALGIELRHQGDSPVWKQAWDVAFAGASLLLALCLGVALGNVLRGVDLDAEGQFFAPLWTDFSTASPVGILDGYTLGVGVGALVVLSFHGACWLAWQAEEPVAERARRLAGGLFFPAALVLPALGAATWMVQPQLQSNFAERPAGLAIPLLGALAMAICFAMQRRELAGRAFVCSGLYIAALLGSAAFAIFPLVLPAIDPALHLSAADAAAPASSLSIALWWWVPGIVLGCGYFAFLYRRVVR